MELEKRERHWIEYLKPDLNKYIPTRTLDEYKQECPEKIHESKTKYRDSHHNILLDKQQQYRNKNKVILNDKNKEYRKANRDRISNKCKEKTICHCGISLRRSDFSLDEDSLMIQFKKKQPLDEPESSIS